ncbi:MAG TPA: PAS domain-containing protein [Rhodoblastus sp.]|mgnify:CR=1 FL=1|nr:PAS domain-containing protein [Rhodoblastus sp.]
MRQQATRELYAYWNALRRQRAAPDRADIDPAAIRSVLSDTFMIETDADSLFPLRLSGARVNALWARDLKGRSFLDLWGEDSANVAAVLLTVMDGACPVVAGAQSKLAGRAPLDVELLLLPLRHHGRTHARVLGSLVAAHTPEWVGLIPIERLELRSLRILSGVQPAIDLPLMRRPPGGVDRRARLVPNFRLIQGGLSGGA